MILSLFIPSNVHIILVINVARNNQLEYEDQDIRGRSFTIPCKIDWFKSVKRNFLWAPCIIEDLYHHDPSGPLIHKILLLLQYSIYFCFLLLLLSKNKSKKIWDEKKKRMKTCSFFLSTHTATSIHQRDFLVLQRTITTSRSFDPLFLFLYIVRSFVRSSSS